eukprot:6202652-Pleurochrysis_carterae.AAC.1
MLAEQAALAIRHALDAEGLGGYADMVCQQLQEVVSAVSDRTALNELLRRRGITKLGPRLKAAKIMTDVLRSTQVDNSPRTPHDSWHGCQETLRQAQTTHTSGHGVAAPAGDTDALAVAMATEVSPADAGGQLLPCGFPRVPLETGCRTTRALADEIADANASSDENADADAEADADANTSDSASASAGAVKRVPADTDTPAHASAQLEGGDAFWQQISNFSFGAIESDETWTEFRYTAPPEPAAPASSSIVDEDSVNLQRDTHDHARVPKSSVRPSTQGEQHSDEQTSSKVNRPPTVTDEAQMRVSKSTSRISDGDREPDQAEIYRQRGNRAFARRDVAAAKVWYEKALVVSPGDACCLNNLSACWLASTPPRHAKAMEVLERILVLAPTDARANERAGRCCVAMGRLQAAAEHFEMGLRGCRDETNVGEPR